MDGRTPMLLRLLTPSGVAAETGCDSVVLLQRADADGRNGGLVGVLKDHAPAIIALAPGAVRASLEGRAVLLAETQGGFASVKENVVTVIADRIEVNI